MTRPPPELDPPEPRWPAIVAVIAVAGLHAALPPVVSVGPRWLSLLFVGLLVPPLLLAQSRGRHGLNIALGHALAAILTAFTVWSLVLLVRALPEHKEAPVELLRSAATLWATNVLIFALWYWRLDAGGPHARDLRRGHPDGAFLFPQMTLGGPGDDVPGEDVWSPTFLDYFFLAFNTSTAFSPTDVPVLSRWAKVLMMTQATISLTVTVILIGRGVNIL